jgi:hypothetical protein
LNAFVTKRAAYIYSVGIQKITRRKEKKIDELSQTESTKKRVVRFQEEILFKKKDNLISALKGLNIRFYLPGE